MKKCTLLILHEYAYLSSVDIFNLQQYRRETSLQASRAVSTAKSVFATRQEIMSTEVSMEAEVRVWHVTAATGPSHVPVTVTFPKT